MSYYAMPRLAALDVRWVDLLDTAVNTAFYRDHYNPYYELIVVADGTVRLKTQQGKLTLEAGDSYLLQPWEAHGGWGEQQGGGKFYWVQFSCSPDMSPFAFNPAADLTVVHAARPEMRTDQDGLADHLILPQLFRQPRRYRLLERFERLLETTRRPTGYFRYQATLLLAEMLYSIAEDLLNQHGTDTSYPLSYVTFRRLVNYLNNCYETDVTKQKLESAIDRKYEYLCQVFKKYAGTTIQQYVQQLRVQRARHLLLHTDRSIKTIAADVGFEEPFYFSRLFKKMVGLSPQHYREQHIVSADEGPKPAK